MRIKDKHSWIKHLDFSIIDLGSLLLAFFISFYTMFAKLYLNDRWREFLVILVLLNIVINLVLNPNSEIFHRRYYYVFGKTFLSVLINALCIVLVFYVFKIGEDYSRQVVIETFFLYYCFAVIFKYFWKKLLISRNKQRARTKHHSLFLICDEENAERDLHNVYAADIQFYNVIGMHIVDAEDISISSMNIQLQNNNVTVPIVWEDYVKYILDNNIDEVLVCVSPDKIKPEVYQTLSANGVGLNLIMEKVLGYQTEEQFVSNIGANNVLSVGIFYFSPIQNSYLVIKRCFDILCGLIGLIVFFPTTLIVKIAYLLSGDKEKILYRQKRIGKNGKPIEIWKYRSMISNADEVLNELLKDDNYRKEWEENQKFENDPRITKVGKFLRKSSIDELPQLLNVLVGDMSLVGPRPLVEGELVSHNGLKLYEKVKPGITGWWGCNGRSNVDYHERLELEYYYVRHCGFYLDLICILKTILAIVKRDGAQ